MTLFLNTRKKVQPKQEVCPYNIRPWRVTDQSVR